MHAINFVSCEGAAGHHPWPLFTLVILALFTLMMLGSQLPDRYRMPASWPLTMASRRVETPSFR